MHNNRNRLENIVVPAAAGGGGRCRALLSTGGNLDGMTGTEEGRYAYGDYDELLRSPLDFTTYTFIVGSAKFKRA